MIVENATIFNGNPYHKLLYSALDKRYVAQKGTAQTAKQNLKNKSGKLLHIHWEEHPLRRCSTVTEAKIVSNRLAESVEEFASDGGSVVWTVHNEFPHELEYVDELIMLRQRLAIQSGAILVHNLKGVEVVNEQAQPKASRIHLLPHPTYQGVYPGGDKVFRPAENEYLFFGMLRAYKGLDFLVDTIAKSPELKERIRLRIRGNTIATDPYATTIASIGAHSFVDLEVGRVNDDRVANLFKNTRAAIIPYERFLTSGVALLAMTFGTPIIAPDTPQMRELLPVECHPFLFQQNSSASLRDAINKMDSLDTAEILILSRAMSARSVDFSPRSISLRLGDVYDSLVK